MAYLYGREIQRVYHKQKKNTLFSNGYAEFRKTAWDPFSLDE